MSKPADKPGRRQPVNAGQEPRRCARCGKDISSYVLRLDPARADVCNECHKELQKEDYLARRNAAKPPVYDIEALLKADRKPWDMVKDLNSRIDPDCPESLLLQPEIVVRDFEDFSPLVGENFGYILRLNHGVRHFLHGLRALRAIGATHLADCMVKARDFATRRGVVFPDPLPDPWFSDDITIDDALERDLNKLTAELKAYDGFKGGDLHKLLVQYLRAHSETLRQRKPA
jgi:hypothetical protein